jgi:hypothetical protein
MKENRKLTVIDFFCGAGGFYRLAALIYLIFSEIEAISSIISLVI